MLRIVPSIQEVRENTTYPATGVIGETKLCKRSSKVTTHSITVLKYWGEAACSWACCTNRTAF